MSHTKKHSRKKLFQILIEYGIHLWILIFVCNVAIFYGFSFFIRASTDTSPPASPSPAPIQSGPSLIASGLTPVESGLSPEIPSPTPTIVIPVPTAAGPVVSLSFSLSGIGTNGGNLKPLHPAREVSVYLYSPDSNTAAKTVRPLHTIKTHATYDADPNSPTYTLFVNKYIDLGRNVGERDRFQIAFKTTQTLTQLIKEPGSNSPGGKILTTPSSTGIALPLPHQVMISGDIYPVSNSNNIMDINDYNMLVNCFSNKASSNRCISGSRADLDDNGVVDGVDYNIMLLSFRSLLAQGLPVPSLFAPKPVAINPIISSPISRLKLPGLNKSKLSPTPVKTGQISPTKIPVKSSKGGGANILLILFGLLIFIGLILFGAFKLHLLDKFLKKIPKGNTPPQTPAGSDSSQPIPTADNTPSTPSSPDQIGVESGSTSNDTQITSPTTTSDTATINPFESKQSPETSTNPFEPGPTKNPTDQPGAAASSTTDVSGTIEKSGFLKKVKVDEQAEGTWVTLADDSGITRGLYQGTNVTDGFVKVKGTMKNDADNKPYILITELTPEG